jgi:hypothetical protein
MSLKTEYYINQLTSEIIKQQREYRNADKCLLLHDVIDFIHTETLYKL